MSLLHTGLGNAQHELSVTRLIDAPRRRVFRAWTEPAKRARVTADTAEVYSKPSFKSVVIDHLKQGTVIRSIRLTNDPAEIDCRHDTIKGLVLRTEFVKKA